MSFLRRQVTAFADYCNGINRRQLFAYFAQPRKSLTDLIRSGWKGLHGMSISLVFQRISVLGHRFIPHEK
jgi:hypothetical protein